MFDIDMTYRHSDQNASQFNKENDDIWRNAEEEKNIKVLWIERV